MSIFILADDNRERIALDGDPANGITIRRRMDMGTRAKVQSAIVRVDASTRATTVDAGAANLALLQHNILAWDGPKFTLPSGKPAPVNAQYIAMLDPADPLLVKVLAELNDRNRDAPSPDPNEAEPNGSMTDGATP